MEVKLEKIKPEDKAILSRLLELYQYDFSEYDLRDLNCHGLYDYRYLDHYWTEDGRHPFFIIVDDKLAGFVLVSDFCYLCEPGEANSISEFFVLRKYRRKGVGKAAAAEIFSMFPGKWEVMQHRENTSSIKFWESVIYELTRGQYRKLEAETEDWTGQALIFTLKE